jgi:SWI/SNF-related matrix-associated actin-dependent regulator 1 of chromatin subfamily A
MTKLKPFQKEGVRRIYELRGRALLADEMGLGKTIQTLDWIRRIPKHRPVVVVCPSSVKYSWQSEAMAHFGIHADVIEGQCKDPKQPLPSEIVIINYDILPSWLKVLQRAKPQVVAIDEAHYIMNLSARRTRAVHALAKKAKSVIATSGTPMTNRPIELWSVLKAVNPNIFPSRQEFAWRYCRPRYTPWGWKYDGASNTEELHRLLRKKVMIRRLKKDVLTELPPVSQRAVPFQLDSYKEYDEAQADFIKWLKKKNPTKAKKAAKSEALTKIGYLIRLCAKLKLQWTENWIRDFLHGSDEKLVALTMHRFVIDHLREVFRGQVLFIDGRVKGKERHNVVRAFQSNRKYRLMLGNWKAAGVGITLTAASNIAALDLPWTPGDLMQGRDRIHRIGQTKPCTLHYLVALQTIEQKLVKMLQKKTKILNAVLDGHAPASRDVNIFDELLDEMKRKTNGF